MSYETGAPPPPPPLPEHLPPAEVVHAEDRPAEVRIEDSRGVPSARPARGYEASAVVVGLGGPPPGTTTYRLRGVESAETTD
jgi:hypothetical protein